MRVLIDYRPALKQRSGVGESIHQLVKALIDGARNDALGGPLELILFSSSWKDRLSIGDELRGVAAIDRRIPVRLLNFAWHRLEWPPAEMLARLELDVVHSPHPLLLPARRAAQVITIHDLDFLAHPEKTRGEIRRDYPALVHSHARRADRIIVPSRFTALEVERRLGVPADRISICPWGAPDWSARHEAPSSGGYVLFFGTLEPRKNVGALLDAYELLLRRRAMPELVLAGKATEQSQPWLDRIQGPPLAGAVRHVGYVDPLQRRELYAGARLLVQPSLEGFGMPVLEAMKMGIPVIVANRGALPELVGDAGSIVDPDNPAMLADAIERMIDDREAAAAAAVRGVARAGHHKWSETARLVYACYQEAIAHRRRV